MSMRYPASQWRTWLSACQQSDLTVVKFCESIGVSVNTYYSWRERLKAEPDDSAQEPVEFIPVSMPAGQIEIELPGGAIARVANETSSLRPLIALLLELGATQ